MQTRCNADRIDSSHHGRRRVTGAFDGGRMSSDGGAPLLREADLLTGLTRGLADCLTDHRDPDRTGHGLRRPVARRVMGIALGYGDINDHDIPPGDGVLALALGRDDVTGDGRRRESDRGAPLAGSSTPGRLEPGGPDRAADDRYRRIAADPEATGRLMPGMFPEAHGAPPEGIVPGPDATDGPPRGRQECRFLHGYYGHHRCLPLYVTCGGHVPCARLRPPDIDASHGALEGPVRGRRRGFRVRPGPQPTAGARDRTPDAGPAEPVRRHRGAPAPVHRLRPPDAAGLEPEPAGGGQGRGAARPGGRQPAPHRHRPRMFRESGMNGGGGCGKIWRVFLCRTCLLPSAVPPVHSCGGAAAAGPLPAAAVRGPGSRQRIRPAAWSARPPVRLPGPGWMPGFREPDHRGARSGRA
ncbi:transposase [Achromobacter marplatensis]|uniref:transposase n=1 Tax=Achromobacter marplatensis TaxID=470868 RepID=UPI003CFCE780